MMSFPAGHYAQNLPYFSLHQVTVKVNKLNKIKFSGECKGKHIVSMYGRYNGKRKLQEEG